MNRNLLLALAVVVLLIGNLIYRVYAGWGLITVHAKGQPLSSVISSIQRQGHARIETDMPMDTPVTMDVVRVTLPDALETLTGAIEGRWRLLYFVAGDKATLRAGETAWTSSGQRPDGWKMVSFPMMGNIFGSGDDDGPPPDPRQDVWTVKTAAPAPVQTFLSEAAQLTGAGFAFPETWNPTVKSAPASGEVRSAVPKLISAAGGKQDPVFFISKPFRRQREAAADDQGGATARSPDFQRPDPEMIAARAQAQINRLPPDERTEAQSNFDSMRTFWQSLQGMTPDQRRAAIQQHMQDPAVQQQMASRMDGRDGRMSHEQRVNRARNYVSRKLTAMGKQ